MAGQPQYAQSPVKRQPSGQIHHGRIAERLDVLRTMRGRGQGPQMMHLVHVVKTTAKYVRDGVRVTDEIGRLVRRQGAVGSDQVAIAYDESLLHGTRDG